MNIRAIVALNGTLLLAGCMVGPKYIKPTVPAPPAYKEQPPESFKESNGWAVAQPGEELPRGKWWTVYNDPQLNELEDQIDSANQTLRVAESRFRQARAAIRFNRSAEYPTISTSPSLENVRDSAHRPYFPPTLTDHSTGDFALPFDLSYEVDLWGKVRRTVSASREEAQATAGDLETARLSLHAELAYDYLEVRSADAQEHLLRETVKAYTDALRITQSRFDGGAAPRTDVTQASTQLEAAEVQEADVMVARSQYEHAIATLIGKAPAQFALPVIDEFELRVPVTPSGLPSTLLERRPDIAANERRVAEANDQIGIARAAFFPSVVLGATAGFEGNNIANWFNWPSRMWAVGPELSQTIFDGGRRHAVSDSAKYNYDGTVATYQQSALSAFQQVEDNLAALRILEHEAQKQREATASAVDSLNLFNQRYQEGVDNYLQVITAQNTALANQRNDIDIERRRLEASVLLIKALGGGWDTSQLPKL